MRACKGGGSTRAHRVRAGIASEQIVAIFRAIRAIIFYILLFILLI